MGTDNCQVDAASGGDGVNAFGDTSHIPQDAAFALAACEWTCFFHVSWSEEIHTPRTRSCVQCSSLMLSMEYGVERRPFFLDIV